MPIYEFLCENGHRVDEFMTMGGYTPAKACSLCGAVAMRVFSPVAIHGIEFSDYRREYRAHPDKHPTAEDNIKFCEAVTGISRDDCRLRKRKPKFIGGGIGKDGTGKGSQEHAHSVG